MDEHVLAVARAAKGFMPDDEGLALYDAGRAAGARGPLLEIGTYCGKSAVYLGAAARAAGTVLFTVDHHRGSEENQAGWEHHDTEVVDPRTGRMDTLPFFRRTIEDAQLEDAVVAVIGTSTTVARVWRTPVAFLFIDGGHAEDIAMADYAQWSPHVMRGGTLAIHDVFEDPADGGQAPFHVWQRAVADGFTPASTTGSLRVLSR
jgi:predicted O-methyltransferase YrrM